MKKKLLLFTQKMDRSDDLLGIYHEWVRFLSEHFSSIEVVCLVEGEHDLPKHVRVHSLGKDQGRGRLTYIWRFFCSIISLRKKYDVVFVHMNPEYVILGGLLWKVWKKPSYMWYAHPARNIRFFLAHFLLSGAVTSVKSAYPYVNNKTHVIGQGIDTLRFIPGRKHTEKSVKLLSLGRISPMKHIDLLLQAVKKLRDAGRDVTATIVGAPGDHDATYYEEQRAFVKEHNLSDAVTFTGKIPNVETPAIYRAHDIFVSLTKIGFFDKTTLEAMASEVPIVVANAAFKQILPEAYRDTVMFNNTDIDSLVRALEQVMDMEKAERDAYGAVLRKIIEKEHNILQLAKRLSEVLHGKDTYKK